MRPKYTLSAFLLLTVILISAARADDQPLSRADWGAPLVNVSRQGNQWTIAGQKQTVTLDARTLAMDIHAGPAQWTMVPSAADDMLVRFEGQVFPLRLADAGLIDIAPYDTGFKTGVKITLSDWRQNERRLGLRLFLTVCLEGPDEDLVCDASAQENGADLRQLDWPTALDPHGVGYTVLSNGRGVLLPSNWPKAYYPDRSTNPDGTPKAADNSVIEANNVECWSMSWWGFAKGASAMMVIVDTPNDAGYQFSHPAGGPTVIGPRWRATLGRFGYMRSCRFCFFPQGNYVTMAKRYRQYVMDLGRFVSLADKIARWPVVKQIIGAPVVGFHILTNLSPSSDMYSKSDPSKNYRLTTFDEAASQISNFKDAGLDHVVVALAGWPRIGYDRQHPDELPPCQAAGGWDGMRRFVDACHKLGYPVCFHDQYRDYYLDAPSYDQQFAIHEEDATSESVAFPGTRYGHTKIGVIPFMDHWMGGTQTYINPRLMPGDLVRNYTEIFAHGIHPDGVYLDVFGYVPPDEDFNPEHPTTRTDAIQARIDCFNWARQHIGSIGTEAGCDWVIPCADYTTPLKSTKGVPIPLYQLVYHDAISVQFSSDDLRGFLNAGIPRLSLNPPPTPEILAGVRRMAALHKRLALVEMTNHEFLDDQHRKERTTYADGTTVTVDWDAKSAAISPDVN